MILKNSPARISNQKMKNFVLIVTHGFESQKYINISLSIFNRTKDIIHQ